MTYEIVPARLEHIRSLGRTMRMMDRAEIEGWGLSVRHTLHALWRDSPIRRTALVDGAVAAVWGVQASMMTDDGQPWLFTAPAIERAKVAFLRETRREIHELLGTYRRLRCYVLASYAQSIRFFEAMGFTIGPPEPVGQNGTPYRLMTLERKIDRRPVVIYALPRSRTFWLSRFLSYGEWEGCHEPGQRFRSIEDVRSWLSQDCTVTADTSAAPWWRLVQHIRSDAHVLIVRRPVGEVVDSLMRIDMRGVQAFDRATLTRRMAGLDRKLDQIERRIPDALSVRFEDLNDEGVCARVFEHCLPYQHDREWWEQNAAVIRQCDLPSLARYQAAHQPQLAKLTAVCREETRRIIYRGRLKSRAALRHDVTIQTEDFATFWRDGQALFAEHAAEAGPRESVMLNPNISMALALEKASQVQIVTARHCGRMVGYLATLISPSLEDVTLVSSMQNTFFVSRDFRGIGMNMEAVSIKLLEALGVREVVFRAGIRADGPRLDALFERLGARETGRLYTMMLKAA